MSLAREEGSRAAPRRLFDAYYRGAAAGRDGGGGDGGDDDVEDDNDVNDEDEDGEESDGARAGMTSALAIWAMT